MLALVSTGSTGDPLDRGDPDTGHRRGLSGPFRSAEGPLTNMCIKYFKHFGLPP